VKLLSKNQNLFEFQLAPREKDLLLELLQLYPQVPAEYQRLSKKPDAEDANQRLLDEAMQESRSENKKQLLAMFSDSNCLSRLQEHWLLKLTESQLEWLLQILNDVRVGSWIQLGSPELPTEALTSKNAPHFWALELAGYFQGNFLEVLDG
jgi:hypothetical protein